MEATLPLVTRQSSSSGGGSDTNAQLLKLVSNPFQSAFQINAFWASLATSLGLTVFLALVFSVMRPRHTLVYAPKAKFADETHAPPRLGKGLLDWIGPVSKAKEDMLVDKIGLDAVLFLRFARMLRNMFIALSFIGLCVMIPVNVGERNRIITQGLDAFAVMTPLYVFGNGLWAQVVCAWAFDIVVAYFLWHNYRRVRQLRRAYLQKSDYQRSQYARSVMIKDLPSNMRSDEGILRLTDEVNPTGVLPRTTIGRNVKILPDLIAEHEEVVRKLESVLAKYLKNPDRLPPSRPLIRPPRRWKGDRVDGKVDAIEYLTARIQELELNIQDVRERVDRRDAMPYGFASWEQIEQAHTVAYAARRKKPHGAMIRLATRPNDIIWKNLPLTKAARTRKKAMNVIWVSILTILWMPLNASIAIFLSNLSNLGSVWPAFQRELNANRVGWAIVQGIASPAITSLVYLVLPIIFRRLQIRAGDVTKTSRERHVLRNLYVFFVLNNLVIFSLFSAVWQYITAVVQANTGNAWDALRHGEFFLTVTTSLCQVSPFWIEWLLQRNLVAAIDISQLWTLFYIWFCRTFLAPTPRQNIEWTAPVAFDYASYYNYFLFYATVALCFSTLQPIVLVVTALYFAIDAVWKKYLLMYVFITKTESGGAFWRTLFNRMIFALILSNILIAVVVKARGTWTMIFAMAPLPILLIGFSYYCSKTFDLDINYYTRTTMVDQERLAVNSKPQRIDLASSKFRHPALYKPLMTPMVHAKARHVLNQIYRGRTGSEGADMLVHSDIVMEPMTRDGQPKTDNGFEIVPEGQQDFAYYKNRSDFRDDGGGIYGGPEDLISERSRTPKSFMGREGRETPSSSRASSPAPDGIYHQPPDESNIHPALRAGARTGRPDMEGADVGVRHGQYTDPYDDRVTLLGAAGEVRAPNGEFMSMDRWRTGGSGATGYGRVGQEEDHGSYDAFRE